MEFSRANTTRNAWGGWAAIGNRPFSFFRFGENLVLIPGMGCLGAIQMPRYFVDLGQAGEVIADGKGMELPDLAAVRSAEVSIADQTKGRS
jgi:hypothetical protein